MEFNAFPKIARLNREMVITEKIDGTNASVEIVLLSDDSVMPVSSGTPLANPVAVVGHSPTALIYAGSRTRYITPENDNQGFAKWVKAHAEELVQLGPGQHFGEWWGQGIQRAYGLTEKRFSLFNATHWRENELRPSCCQVVSTLFTGPFNTLDIQNVLDDLRSFGSHCAAGFMKPEGIVVYHTAANQMFKVTLEKDEQAKGTWKGMHSNG